ncbi:hypothetical protein SISNIDRAFT_451557 [Sistotremastrum niveocremeum HHB9708]|uniref:Methyltransferase domain-containing protein n=1 Tax=Sistotremastrum niveocremeum HHB9708 TaxID=1314777 RepID=A0A164XEX3_9AGAM|nr:hypothetical protein SISNIDRAFT_451557 [Sistotremastrum niveocremeum HHB9708]
MSDSTPQNAAPLRLPSVVNLGKDELEFLKTQMKIDDEDELKAHILAVQKEDYAISRYPIYPQILKLGRERPGAILLDIGCCFGNDARKAVADGFPIDQVITSDLREGHKFYKSTPESYPVRFIPGDIFDPALIAPAEPLYGDPPAGTVPSLKTISSLTPLTHRVSIIHASSFFHLFNEENQTIVAKRMAGLLSPEAGSIICGSHIGAKVKGVAPSAMKKIYFGHSPESWNELWDGVVFKKGTVKCVAGLYEVPKERLALLCPGADLKGPQAELGVNILAFSITRL